MTRSEKLYPTVEEIGGLKIEGGATMKEFLRDILLDLWDQEEMFDPKRPWGESNWKFDLYIPLVNAGFVDGEPNGKRLKNFDQGEADRLINWVIKDAFSEN